MDRLPPKLEPRTRFPRIFALCVGLAAAAGAGVLFFLDPATHGFYPQCLFHRLTGLDCPGCGGLRAMHQLLHGHVGQAFYLNALVVLGLPLVAGLAAREMWRWARGGPPPRWLIRPTWLWVLLTVLVIFGVLRNLPVPALARLAP